MEANPGVYALHPGMVIGADINVPDVSGLPAPYISPQNWQLSTKTGGNPRGYNIVKDPRYQPSPFMVGQAGYTLDPVTGQPVADTAGLQDYQLPPGDFVQDGKVVGKGGVPIPDVELDGSKQPDRDTVEEMTSLLAPYYGRTATPPAQQLTETERLLSDHYYGKGKDATDYVAEQTLKYFQGMGDRAEEQREEARPEWMSPEDYDRMVGRDWSSPGEKSGEKAWLTGPHADPAPFSNPIIPLANIMTIMAHQSRTTDQLNRKMVRKDPETGDWYWGLPSEKEEISYEHPFTDKMRAWAGGDLAELGEVDTTPSKAGLDAALDYYTRGDIYDHIGKDAAIFGMDSIVAGADRYMDSIHANMVSGGFATEDLLPDYTTYIETLSDSEKELFLIIYEAYRLSTGGDPLSGPLPTDPVMGGWYGGYGDPYLNYDWGGGGYSGGGSYDQFIMSPALTRWNYS